MSGKQAQLDRLEREYVNARDAGDREAMKRIRVTYHKTLFGDSHDEADDAGAAQMLENCIAEYFHIKAKRGGEPPLTSRDFVPVAGSRVMH